MSVVGIGIPYAFTYTSEKSWWQKIQKMVILFAMRRVFASIVILSLVSSCSMRLHRPCSEGGEVARATPTKGTKQCHQIKGADGKFVNNGLYREWYPNGQLAIEGEYREGRKHEKWTEWDEKGNRLHEKWYLDGKEVPPPR